MLIQTIIDALGAPTVLASMPMHHCVKAFCIDSRIVNQHDLFFALPGVHCDGHDFLGQVADKQAYAVVLKANPQLNLTQWEVDDVALAMGILAKAYRETVLTIPLAAITGSCGKTTVSYLLAQIARLAGKTLASEKSFNNHLGVPLTLSKIEETDQYIIQEMGANAANEIAYLTDIAKPTVALINMVAPVHLEGFGDLDGVARAKSEIYQGLQQGGYAVINADDAYADFCMGQLRADIKRILFSYDKADAAIGIKGQVHLKDTESIFTLRINKNIYSIVLPLIGKHNIMNALAATACAVALGIDDALIVQALVSAQPPEQRLIRHDLPQGYTLFDDSYNANPVAVNMAMQSLPKTTGRKIMVFADMGECGEQAIQFHKNIAENAKQAGIDKLYCYGDLSRITAINFGAQACFFSQKDDLIQILLKELKPDDVILIKGSNSMGLATVVQALLQQDINKH